jgi:hypothetical protein
MGEGGSAAFIYLMFQSLQEGTDSIKRWFRWLLKWSGKMEYFGYVEEVHKILANRSYGRG